MSNPESFIDEVTEEVQRDRLYATFRKYAWVGVTLVVVIVGGTVVNEWLRARDRAAAEAAGDAILAAVEAEDAASRVAALDGIEAEGERAALLALITAAEDDDPARAADRLAAIAADTTLPGLYRDLATLKSVMVPGAPVAAPERLAALEPLTAPGAPFRVLAEEQMALAELEQGDAAAALTRLQALLSDTEASEALRRRASQLIVALGGTPEGA